LGGISLLSLARGVAAPSASQSIAYANQCVTCDPVSAGGIESAFVERHGSMMPRFGNNDIIDSAELT
jgi:hypothetical protein